MKYTMYKYDVATKLWNIYRTFGDKDELLRFLCYGTQTHNGLPRRRWTNKYFDEQNLTRKDILVNTRWEKQYDEDGNLLIRYGMPVYSPCEYRTIREWHLEDAEGRTVDANIFKEEVDFTVALNFRSIIYAEECISSRFLDKSVLENICSANVCTASGVISVINIYKITVSLLFKSKSIKIYR